MRLELKMEFPADYPESVPIFNVRGIKGLTRAQVDPLHTLLGEKCEEMLGMQMVFELTTYIQEWMANGAKDPNDKGEGFEAPTVIETKKKHGTQVTRENFAEWIAGMLRVCVCQKHTIPLSIAFTAEMEKAEKKGKTTGAAAAPVADGTRLTGRQIFEKAAGVDWELFGGMMTK